MSTQHTPGPWKCSQYLGQSAWVVHMDVGDRGRGMEIVDGVAGLNSENRLANARLIAAAPDLLEALQSYSLAIDENNIALSCIEFGAEAVERELKRRAAIAKATGPQGSAKRV